MGLFSGRTLFPKNYGRAKEAQLELDWTYSRANAQHIESIKVDGITCTYWKKTNEGNFCTCIFGIEHHANISGTGTVTGNIDTPSSGGFTTRTTWDDKEPVQSPAKFNVLGAEVTRIPSGGEGGDDTTQKDYTDLEKPVTSPEDEESAFLRAPSNSDLLFGVEKVQCGICLGAGKTGSWNLVRGKRMIFDSTNTNALEGFVINKESRPYAFESPRTEKNYVEWIQNFPTYFKNYLSLAVRNNTKAALNLAVYYKLFGTADAFQPLTIAFLNSRQGIPTKLILHVQSSIESLESINVFTHIEINVQYNDFVLIQMSNLSVASNPQIADVQVNTSFTFGPEIDNVSRDDVFFESKYNRMWKISDVTDFMSRNKIVLGWTVSARNLQLWEQQSLLRLVRDVTYGISFAGLQPFQNDFLKGSGDNETIPQL
jgi:hypothetical protein